MKKMLQLKYHFDPCDIWARFSSLGIFDPSFYLEEGEVVS